MQTFCGLATDGMYDYLAAIYRLAQAQEKVSTTALAAHMHVSPAATSSMLKRLEESDLIRRSTAGGIQLSEQGRLAALQMIRRHRLLEVFLIDVMNFTWDQVDVEAHRLEHAISQAFEARMDALCGYPTHCPHGDPIPSVDGRMEEEPLRSVISMQPGERAILRRVGNRDASVLRYLSNLNLMPGREICLVECAPFKGPVTLEIQSSPQEDEHVATAILGNELADQLYVSA